MNADKVPKGYNTGIGEGVGDDEESCSEDSSKNDAKTVKDKKMKALTAITKTIKKDPKWRQLEPDAYCIL